MHKNSQHIVLQRFGSEASMDISLHKTCSAMVSGTVFNTNGEVISNVTVKLVDQKLNPIMHTTTSKDGSYVLLLHDNDEYQLIIAKPGFETLLVSTITCNHPMNITLNNMQLTTCDVVGQCFYMDGTPAKDTVVILDKDTTNHRMMTDCYGCFAYFQVGCGLHRLEMLGETCETYKAYFEVYKSDKLIELDGICLERKNIGCTIHGIIKDQDGVLLSNVLVLLYCSICKRFIKRTYTNKDGVYFYGNLKKGSYYIKAIY